MKLGDIVDVKIGRNLSRGSQKDDQTLVAYSYEDLNDDLNGEYLSSNYSSRNHNRKGHYLSVQGEVVFSFVSSKAGIVSELNQGKVLNQNFANLIVEYDKLDRSYLCYALNESLFIKKQMAVFMQGSAVRKLTPSSLKELEISLPTIERQRLIGNSYFYLLKRQALAKKQAI